MCSMNMLAASGYTQQPTRHKETCWKCSTHHTSHKETCSKMFEGAIHSTPDTKKHANSAGAAIRSTPHTKKCAWKCYTPWLYYKYIGPRSITYRPIGAYVFQMYCNVKKMMLDIKKLKCFPVVSWKFVYSDILVSLSNRLAYSCCHRHRCQKSNTHVKSRTLHGIFHYIF